MRRFLLLVFVVCAGVSAAFSLWPRQLGGYLALFGQRTSVNSGVAVTVLAVLVLLLIVVLLVSGGHGPRRHLSGGAADHGPRSSVTAALTLSGGGPEGRQAVGASHR